MFIRTAQGVTSSSKQGRLSTAHGDFVGYIVPESEYSLWSLETEMQRDGVYTQSKHTAEMRYSDGTVRQYYQKNRMWVVDVCGSDCEVACAACEKKLEHAAKGHPHDPQCEHCMRGRMRARARPRRTLVTNNQTGVTVYLDLMGPFEPDVTGSVYEMTVLL